MRRTGLLLTLAAILALPGFASSALAQVGPPGGTIWAHNVAYQTVATPRDLPPHGKFDTIYIFEGYDSVAESAPGDQDFNGGRWEVRPVEFLTIAPKQFKNAEDIKEAAMQGEVSIGDVVRRFECPLIPAR